MKKTFLALAVTTLMTTSAQANAFGFDSIYRWWYQDAPQADAPQADAPQADATPAQVAQTPAQEPATPALTMSPGEMQENIEYLLDGGAFIKDMSQIDRIKQEYVEEVTEATKNLDNGAKKIKLMGFIVTPEKTIKFVGTRQTTTLDVNQYGGADKVQKLLQNSFDVSTLNPQEQSTESWEIQDEAAELKRLQFAIKKGLVKQDPKTPDEYLVKTTSDVVLDNMMDIADNKKDIADNKKGIADNRALGLKNEFDIGVNAVRGIANEKRSLSNEKRIVSLEESFKAMSKDYNSFKTRTNGAIAGVAAMGQLAQPYGVGNMSVGVGVGSYYSEQAIAVGMGYRANENVTMRAAVAANTSDDMKPIIAASVNYEW